MKAAVLTEWEKIEYKEVPKPQINEGECLVRVAYAGICGSDLHIYNGHHPTAKAPVILGHEFVGVIEALKTSQPTTFKIGDRVVVEPLISCNACEACREGNWHVCRTLKLLGIHTDGAFAEYVKVDLKKVIKISDRLSDRVAALTEPFAVGFHVNQRAGLKNGDNVLVIGGGPIGLIVGMVAKIGGAAQVIFSEINPARIKQIESFGFTTINPTQNGAMETLNQLTDNAGFDVVFEASGSQPGLSFAVQACKIRGTVVLVGFPAKEPECDNLKVIFKELKLVGTRVYTFTDFQKTTKMLENIVQQKLFDLEKLISDTYELKDLEQALLVMKAGGNLGKILVKL